MTVPRADASAAVPWRALVAVVVCVSVFDVTLGLTYPLLAFMLEARGVDATVIGLNAAMTSLGLVLFSPFVPPLARRFGSWRFALACMAGAGVILVLFKAVEDLAVWFALRFALGMAESGLFSISEAWVNELAGSARRGRVIAVYSSLLSAGFAAGPFLLAAVGTEGWAPFLVGLGFAAGGMVFLLAVRNGVPVPPAEDRASLIGFLPRAPILLLAVVAFALFDTATMSLFPLYGLRAGLDEATAAAALGVLIAGNVLLQFPIGWLSDRVPRRLVLVACAGLTAAGALLLPPAVGSWWLWPLLFLWGSTAFGVYTMAMTELGDRFRGALLIAGAAAFAAAWGAGGIVGPPLGGAAMELFGPDGLPYVLAATFAALAIAAAARWSRRRRGGG